MQTQIHATIIPVFLTSRGARKNSLWPLCTNCLLISHAYLLLKKSVKKLFTLLLVYVHQYVGVVSTPRQLIHIIRLVRMFSPNFTIFYTGSRLRKIVCTLPLNNFLLQERLPQRAAFSSPFRVNRPKIRWLCKRVIARVITFKDYL